MADIETGMCESELITHALGMKAYLAGEERLRNPFCYTGADGLTILLCRAWFQGWDDAKSAAPR